MSDASPTKKRRALSTHFPNLYLWLVFLSAMDVVLTRVILYFGGMEVNPLADWIIKRGGQMGMSLFKFSIVIFVILVCEYAARLDTRTARRLAIAGCVISAVPVVWSSVLVVDLIATFEPGTETIYPPGLEDVFNRRDMSPR